MIKKVTAVFVVIIATFSLNVSAQLIKNLNSSMSTIDINQALKRKMPVMPYAGKDFAVGNLGELKAKALHSNKFIC